MPENERRSPGNPSRCLSAAPAPPHIPPAPASPYRSSPANRLFPKASALYFYSFLPLSFLPAAKRSAIFSPLFISFARFSPQHAFRAGIRRTFSRSKQNAPPLPASPRLFFFLSPQYRPVRCHILSVFLLPLPARSSAFRLNAILSVVTFPLHVTFPCSRFRLSPQSRPSVVTSLFPLAFTACASLFPNPVFTAGKRPQKKSFPYGKDFLSSALPNPANKKTFSERTLKRFPFKMDQTNSMMTRRAASPLRGSSFMIRV